MLDVGVFLCRLKNQHNDIILNYLAESLVPLNNHISTTNNHKNVFL